MMDVAYFIFSQLAEHGSVTRKDLHGKGYSLENIHEALIFLEDVGLLTNDNEQIRPLFYYQPLNLAEITALLPPLLRDHLDISIKFITGSTNIDAAQGKTKMGVVLSEMQQQGRGRHGKKWQSPLAKNIYLSMRLTFEKTGITQLSTLSLWVGIYLAEILREHYHIPATVKWPNDIWVEGKKLAGILIENSLLRDRIVSVIGIGINIHPFDLEPRGGEKSSQNLTNFVTSCEALVGKNINRNLLVGRLIVSLWELYKKIESGEGVNISAVWPKYSALIHQDIRLFSEKETIKGREIGVQNDGGFVFVDNDNQRRIIYSGELSLRPL